MKKRIIWGVLIILFLAIICVLWSLNYQEADVLPPVYLDQMRLCEQEGGIVEKKTKDVGGFDILDQWRCVCEDGVLFFGMETDSEKLLCQQWLDPKLSEVSSTGSWFKRLFSN